MPLLPARGRPRARRLRPSSPRPVQQSQLLFERLESRILFSADPVATVDLPAEELVNEEVTFEVTFDNQGTSAGFNPYVDIVVPEEMVVTDIQLYGSGANNSAGAATTPVGEIDSNGLLVDSGTSAGGTTPGTEIDHPEYVGNPAGSFGTIGSATAPVDYSGVGKDLTGFNVYTVALPFGSFSESNPPAVISVTATINTSDGVVPEEDLCVFAQAGFAYGNDPLNNPDSDTPLVGSGSSDILTPKVIDLSKTASVPEEDGPYTGEQASGPNHPLTYTLTVDIANGETIDDLVITDLIPGDVAYLGGLTVTTGQAHTIDDQPAVNVDGITGTDPTDNEILITFTNPVVGGATDADVVITYQAFIPFIDADTGGPVIDPNSGDQVDLEPYNDSAANGSYDHPDPTIDPVPVEDNAGPANPSDLDGNTDYRIEEHSLATQKNVALVVDNNVPELSNFDVLEYTIDFQVSDYFALDQLQLVDTLGDGQLFLPDTANDGIVPQLVFQMHGEMITVDFDPSNVSVVAAGGDTEITFDIYQQLVDSMFAYPDGTGGTRDMVDTDAILGAFIPAGGLMGASMGSFNAGSPTLGTVRFRAQVEDEFSDGESIVQGDSVGNNVVIEGRNLDVDDFTPIGPIQDDDSTASSEIRVGEVEKSVYAVTSRDGSVTFNPSGPTFPIATGDIVTYSIVYELPLTRFKELVIDDFVPQPALDVTTLDDSQVFAYDMATFNTAGRISYGPTDTFFGPGGPGDGATGVEAAPLNYAVPLDPSSITFDGTDNSFQIVVGDYDPGVEDPVATRIEFLVSLRIEDAVFEDGLLFTNQTAASEENSEGDDSASDDIAGGVVTAPSLQLDKGIVATTNTTTGTFTAATGPAGVTFNAPGSASAFSGTINTLGLGTTRIDSDLEDLDAGDVVTFVITAENVGRAKYGVFDITIEDDPPPEYEIPSTGSGLNLRVTDGAGNALSYSGDLFSGGITLDDPSDIEGALSGVNSTTGSNILIIAYDLALRSEVEPREDYENTAEILSYASGNGNANYAPAQNPDDITDTALTTMRDVTVEKRVVSTSFSDTDNQDHGSAPDTNPFPDTAIGEVVTYEVVVTIPEGTLSDVTFVDQLQTGLAFLDLVSVVPSDPARLTSSAGAFTDVVALISGGSSGSANEGRTLELGFGSTAGLGDLTVLPSTDDAGEETLTITYRAVVLNVTNNQEGNARSNGVDFTWSNDDGDQTVEDRARVRIVEPNVTVDKTVDQPTAAGDDVVTYTVTVRNDRNGSHTSEAFEVELLDYLPEEVSYVSGSLSFVGGVAPDVGSLQFIPTTGGVDDPEGSIVATWERLGVNEQSQFTFQARVDDGLPEGLTVTNEACVEFTSLPDTEAVDNLTPNNDFGAERTGDTADTGGAANDYEDCNDAEFDIQTIVSVGKVVSDTSEGHTLKDRTADLPLLDPVNGAIGEVVRYEVALTIPQASFTNVSLVDTLDPGLVWIDPAENDVRIRFLGFAADGSTLVVDPDLEAANGSTISLPDARIAYDSGTNEVTFTLGDITNLETDALPESVVLIYNVIVRNDGSVSAGDTLTNSVQARVDGVDVGNPLSTDVIVVEPDLTIEKSDGGVSEADAGDVIDYTLTVTAGNGANTTTAFDLLISDTLPDELEYVATSLMVTGLPGYATLVSSGVTGQDVSVEVSELRPGDTFDVTFQARVRDTGADTIRAGQNIENTARLDYSSLPGAGTPDGTGDNTTGSEAGTPGDEDGERLYDTSDDDDFDVPEPTITKTFDSTQPAPPAANSPTDEATIGEVINYEIVVEVPEGITGDPVARVVDTIDPGLSLVTGSVAITMDSGVTTTSQTISYNDPGTDQSKTLQIDFGRIEFAAPPPPADDGLQTGRITITYQLQVENTLTPGNTPVNEAGDVVGNEADFVYSSGDDPTMQETIDDVDDDDTDVTIVEPELTVSKSANPTSGDAGDVIAYTVVITNITDETAYDITYQDLLPTNLRIEDLTSFEATESSAGDRDGDFTVAAGRIDHAGAGFDLVGNSSITITYNAVIQDAVVDGDSLVNEVDLEWTSLDGDITGERTGDGNLNTVGTQDPPNDYEADSDATVTVDLGYTLAKSVLTTDADTDGDGSVDDDVGGDGTEELTIGETVTFQVVATLGEGTTENLVVTDTLPDNATGQLVFVSARVSGVGANVSGDPSGPNLAVGLAPTSVVGNVITWELNDVTVAGTDGIAAAADRQITFEVVAQVSNVIENQEGDTLTNNAQLSSDDGETVNASEDVEIVEPTLTVDKSVTPTTGDAGDVLTYTVVIENTSDYVAFDVTYQDILPAGIRIEDLTSFDATESSAGDRDGDFLVAADRIDHDGTGFDLAAGSTITITYDAVIQDTVVDGDSLVNNVELEWTSMPGDVTGERTGDGLGVGPPTGVDDYEDRSDATVTVDLGYTLAKTVLTTDADTDGDGSVDDDVGGDGTEDLTIGETVTFQVVATLGEGTTENLVVTDTLPDNATGQLIFVSARVSGVGANVSGDPSGPNLGVGLAPTSVVGNVITWELNDVTVAGTDGIAAEADRQITFEVVAQVSNVIENQEGDTLTNNAQLSSDDGETVSASEDVEIVEPTLTVDKSILVEPAQPDAGTTVTYQIVIENTSDYVAFDATFVDILPPEMDIVLATFVATETTSGDRDTDFVVTADEIRHAGTGFDLDPGASITITYDAVILPTVVDGQSLVNDTELEWTSMPGDVGQERTGDGIGNGPVDPGDLDNYEDRDREEITAELNPVYNFTKEVFRTSADHTDASGGSDASIEDLVVGEEVIYRLTVDMANGTSNEVMIVDQLDLTNGILDIREVTVTLGSNLTSSNSPVVPVINDRNNDGYDDEFSADFGTVVNDVSSSAAEDAQIIIDVRAVVVNVIENQEGDVIDNVATFSVLADVDNDGDADDLLEFDRNVEVELLEPTLTIEKAVNNDAVKLGETLTYTLTITSEEAISTTDAFDVAIVDTLDTGLILDTGSIQINNVGSQTQLSSIIVDSSTASGINLLLDVVEEGAVVEITYEVMVTTDLSFFDAVLNNTVEMTYTSLPDGNAAINGDERGGTEDTSDPNDYIDDAMETVEVFQPDLTIDKTVNPEGEVIVPGEEFTYTLVIENIGRRTATGVLITDDVKQMLDDGFEFVSATDGGVLIDGVVTWNLPDLDVGNTDTVMFTMRAPRVIPAGLEVLPNVAVVDQTCIDPTPENNIDDEESIVRAFPDLAVTKTDGLEVAQVGQLITYTIGYQNIGNQVATGVVIRDTLPPGVEFISATDGGTLQGNQVVWNIGTVVPGQTGTVSATVRLLTPGTKINVVVITDDGSGGPDPTPENNIDEDVTNHPTAAGAAGTSGAAAAPDPSSGWWRRVSAHKS